MAEALCRKHGEAMMSIYRFFFFTLAGWRIEDLRSAPLERFIVVVAPHTSNWDLPFMLGVALKFRIRLHWMGKDNLFKPPFGWFMRALWEMKRPLSAPFLSSQPNYALLTRSLYHPTAANTNLNQKKYQSVMAK